MSGDRHDGAHGSADPVEAQLVLQRRILRTLADRETELRALRYAEAACGDAGGEAADDRPEATAVGRGDGLRRRWLAAKAYVVECEERIDVLERELARAGAAAAVGTGGDLDRPIAACTIVCQNYLAHARALLESIGDAEPTARRYLLVLDAEPDEIDAVPGVEIISPRRLRVPDFAAMSFKYGIVEFNTAVKPYLLSLLFDEYGEDEVAYFDPDILVMRRLDELRRMLDGADIVLTPHITRPIPDDGLAPSEPDIMVSGAYNLGFIAVRRTEEARRFLEWWERRLEDGCRIDVPGGLFTDQKWIDLVPGLFPGTAILRDPAYNVAFWNLHERTIDRDDGAYLVNGQPAGFFHISGFDPRRPDLLSKHQTRTTVEPDSGLAALLEDYAGRLEAHGYADAHAREYGYDRFADGVSVHPFLRRLYLGLTAADRSRFGDPFTRLGTGGFREWATRPRPECGGLSYFLLEVYQARVDLQHAFPDVRDRDRPHFIEWARTQGPLEMHYDPSLVRDPEEGALTDGGPDAEPVPDPEDGQPRHYVALVDRIRGIADEALPAGATVAVVSRGDYRLMHLGGRQAWHFPRTETGLYAGYHPRTSEDAIDHLEALRAAGADFLLFPATSIWWLDHYEGFRDHLEGRYPRALDDPAVCVAFDLTRSANGDGATHRKAG